MTVGDRVHVGPPRVDFAVDETLQIGCASVVVLRVRLQVKRHDIGSAHELGRQRARKQIAIRALRMADAHVAEAVENAKTGENPVGRDQIIDRGGKQAHDGAILRAVG